MSKLRFDNLTLRYGSRGRGADAAGLTALDGFSLEVAPGQSVAIIGPSGCGKSTALRLAAGLLAPTRGTVLVDGQPLRGPRPATAIMLQGFGLFPWKTCLKNVELGLKLRGMPRAQRRQRALEVLRTVGLSGFADSYPRQLSGGMQQRLALARSIALDVDLLLMDEPLSALDALLREQLQDVLLASWRRQGYAQVLVTHSIDEAVFLGQRVVVMSAAPGRVIATLDNPQAGRPAYRGSALFHARCDEVRGILRQATCQGGDA